MEDFTMDVVTCDSDDATSSLAYVRNQRKLKQQNQQKKNDSFKNSQVEFHEISDDDSDLNSWCSITVEMKTKATRNDVFYTIIHNVQPNIFIPVLCQKGNAVNKFYLCNSEPALKKLSNMGFLCVRDKLCFQLRVNHSDSPIHPVDIKKTIDGVLMSQMTMGSNELNLSNFHNHPDIIGKMFLPLSFTANQVFVNSRVNALSLTPHIYSLNLEKNGIEDIKGFNMVYTFKNLTSLNLSNNNLKSMQMLFQCRSLDIQRLYLDGNELCSKYSTAAEYTIPIMMFFPGLKELDGKMLSSKGQIPVAVRNYAVNNAVTELVDQFMETYYRLFDSDERGILLQMYADNALLNLHINKQNTRFFKNKRPVHQYRTPRAIIGCLNSLPYLQHDPYGFTVDVPYATDSSVCIVISGVLKIPSQSLNEEEPVYDFNRTFILAKTSNCRFKITNDIFHILPKQTMYSNAFSVTEISKESLSLTPSLPFSEASKDGLVDLLMRLSELSEGQSVSILLKADWNFQKALAMAITSLQDKLSKLSSV